ncbi:ArpU family phage packaging/lysis transcriptional regulator [Paenibacillus puldeungensis]|uniref:ArpU family phage packaging/lysis transcriptional regulator n=1 Tax=Paenibacillus puldeungensis TaxID=696536 RepID=A0ABW3S355_9BACL
MRAEAKDVYQLALMEINREETRRRTEKELETARVYNKVGFVRKEIKNTPNYEPREHQGTNAISKPCEDVAVWNVDNEVRLKQAHERVQTGLRALKRVERQIIEMRYLEDEDVTDFQVYMELHLSERSYYRRKSGALYKMAFAMGLEVYITDETA